MSIDKESSGLPGIDVHRRTTKVNLALIGGILLFFAIAALAAGILARRAPASQASAPPTQSPAP